MTVQEQYYFDGDDAIYGVKMVEVAKKAKGGNNSDYRVVHLQPKCDDEWRAFIVTYKRAIFNEATLKMIEKAEEQDVLTRVTFKGRPLVLRFPHGCYMKNPTDDSQWLKDSEGNRKVFYELPTLKLEGEAAGSLWSRYANSGLIELVKPSGAEPIPDEEK